MFVAKYTITNQILKDIGAIEASKEIIENSPISNIWLNKFIEQRKTHTLLANLKLEGINLDEDTLSDALAESGERYLQTQINSLKSALEFIEEIYTKLGPKNAYFLTPETLFEIHSRLVKDVSPTPGKLRTSQVVLKHSTTGEISYTPPPAAEVPYLLEDLINWVNSEETKIIHPILKSGIIHFELIRIHPFVQANNSSARLLSMLILYLEGYSLKDTLCIEEELAEDILKYHLIIHSVANQDVIDVHERDLTAWLEYFVSKAALQSINIKDKFKRLSAETILADKLGERVDVNERQLMIIDYLKKHREMRNKDFRKIFPDFSDDTVLRELKFMKQKGLVKKEGGTKNAVYVLAEPGLNKSL